MLFRRPHEACPHAGGAFYAAENVSSTPRGFAGRLKPLKAMVFFCAQTRYNPRNFSSHTEKWPPGHFFIFDGSKMDIQNLLDKTLPGLGYEPVDFEMTPQGTLRVFIDKEGGITVEDCVTVSNHLSRLFIVEDVDYKNLEISSPGLDRPLKKAADFVRFAGQEAKIKTRLPIEGQKNFIGRIESCVGETVTLSFDGKTAAIALDNIDKARLKPEFKF